MEHDKIQCEIVEAVLGMPHWGKQLNGYHILPSIINQIQTHANINSKLLKKFTPVPKKHWKTITTYDPHQSISQI